MADIKNFGLKGTSADVQLGKKGGRIRYVTNSIYARDAADTFYLTMHVGTPTENSHAATKAYVDLNSDKQFRQATIGTGASQNIGAPIPPSAIVQKTKLQILTAYDNAATISIGNGAEIFMTVTENDPEELSMTFVSERSSSTQAGGNTQLSATVGNAPTVGSALATVEYVVV